MFLTASPNIILRRIYSTRGWTLQELIANPYVEFFDAEWNHRGSKTQLALQLSSITKIDLGLMQGTAQLSSFCVSQKMSWAAQRETTRVEDMAYCLLGIFDVNMPLLYGEEQKAFQRLQEEIIRTTPDSSIFAWTKPLDTQPDTPNPTYCGLLAKAPCDFCDPNAFGIGKINRDEFDIGEFSLSNVGLKSQAPILTVPTASGRSFYILPLCPISMDLVGISNLVGIRLRKRGSDTFIRADPWSLRTGSIRHTTGISISGQKDRYYLTKVPEQYHIYRHLAGEDFIRKQRPYSIQLCRSDNEAFVFDLKAHWPVSRFDQENFTFFSKDAHHDCCMMNLGINHAEYGRFDFVFCALDWSSDKMEYVQCTLIECDSNLRMLGEMHQQIERSDNRAYFVGQLLRYRVRKSNSVILKKIGSSRCCRLTYVLESLVNPVTSSSHHSSWKVIFKTEAFEVSKPSKIIEENWKFTG